MNLLRSVVVPLCGLALLVGGCSGKKEPDTANFKSAINSYYSAYPQCLWASPVKFPAQADAGNDQQTQGFDALTDAGLLTRQAEEKKRFLIGSKQVNLYDLSDKGRSAWTPDQAQPGYGNFCYGHREATSIDGFVAGANQSGTPTETVSYHYDLAGVPDWAKSREVRTAFTKLSSDLSGGQADQATLVQIATGWQVVEK